VIVFIFYFEISFHFEISFLPAGWRRGEGQQEKDGFYFLF
jgi:hypothetical protein